MKLFLDECVDRRLARHIAGHEISTARQMGWTSIKNGELLARVGDVAKELGKDGLIVMNMCGRSDKDIFSVAAHLGMKI